MHRLNIAGRKKSKLVSTLEPCDVMNSFRKHLLSAILLFSFITTTWAQKEDKMPDITIGSFSNKPLDEITDNVLITFKFAARKGSSTQTYFPGSDNFTWYYRMDRTSRIYLNDSILAAGIAVHVNNTSLEQLVELNAVLYSLAGNKVNKSKLPRKAFTKSSKMDHAVYTLPLAKAFSNAIIEINYSIEVPFDRDRIFWRSNELFGLGRARYEFKAPEYLDFQFEYLNLRQEDVSVTTDNNSAYMSYEVIQNDSGRPLGGALLKINTNYLINRTTIVITANPKPRDQRAISAKLVAVKPVPTR